MKKLFFAFADAKYPIVAMSVEEATLERIFLRLTANNTENEKSKKKKTVKNDFMSEKGCDE